MREASTAAFLGVERRRHFVYITRNTEYHFRDKTCVAVRDRRTGDFLRGHLALNRRLRGTVRFFGNGAICPSIGEPRVGEALFFESDGRDLLTSPLERIDRPSKDTVELYPPMTA